MKAKNSEVQERVDAAELGAMMREMRENLGHDLKDVAEDLRIRLVYLEAIEGGKLSLLPGSAYVSGFIRSYSEFLGLDGEEIVRRFRMAGAEISGQTRLHLPSPVEEGRLPTMAVLLVAAIIAGGAYGGWYYLSSHGKLPVDSVAPVPAALSEGSAPAPAPAPATAPAPAPATPPATAAAPATAPATTPATAPDTSVAPSAAPPATPSPARPPAEVPAETPAEAPAARPQGATAGSPAAAPDTAVSGAPETVEPQVRDTPPPVPVPPQTEAPAPAAAPAARIETPAAAPSAPVPPSLPPVAAAKPEAVPEPAPRPAPPSAAASPGAEPAEAASDPDSTPDSTPTPSPVVMESASAGPGAAPQTASAPGTNRIVIRAVADSYVAVLTSDAQPLFAQLMRPGDSYEVPSGAHLVLQTGNAGGLQITVGGRQIPPLGQTGDVRDNILLDADSLLRTAR